MYSSRVEDHANMSNYSKEDALPWLWREFSKSIQSFGDRTAVVTPEGEASFEQLLSGAENLAGQLFEAGLKPGDVVGHALPNCIDFVISWLALCRLSAIAMLVSTKYQASELTAIVEGVRPDFFLTTEDLSKDLEARLPSTGSASLTGTGRGPLTLLSINRKKTEIADDTWRRRGDDTSEYPALIKLTSGSTGIPKGILLSAGNVLAGADNVVQGLSLTPKDQILSAVPAFHSYGFDLGVLASLRSGARLELRETFIPRRILSELSRPDISVFLGVPSMYRFFLDTRLEEPPDLSHLRYPLSCTAPLDPEIVGAFHQKFGATICQHYGSSETGAATTQVPDEALNRSDSVGQVMQGVEIKTVDSDGRELPTGTEGEVVIASQAVAQRYLMGQPRGRSPIQNGVYLTGDIGRIDKDGFLYVTGRIDKLINVGGLKVSPDEVVRVLESCPAVSEAAVTGIRDDNDEEIVFAAVTLSSSANENDILNYCRSRLAEYKVPRRIDIRRELPRTATGKIRLRPGEINS